MSSKMEKCIFLVRKYFGPIHKFKDLGSHLQCLVNTPGHTKETLAMSVLPNRHVLLEGSVDFPKDGKSNQVYELVYIPREITDKCLKRIQYDVHNGVTRVYWIRGRMDDDSNDDDGNGGAGAVSTTLKDALQKGQRFPHFLLHAPCNH